MSNPVDVVPDVLVLAAVDRAVRHRGKDASGVPVWAILEHLEIPMRSKRARTARARLEALGTAGLLVRSRRHGVPVWTLSRTGRRRLRRAQAASRVPALPESPQHRAWRDARAAANQEIKWCRQSVRETLREAASLLGTDPRAHSDAWFDVSERLHRVVWRLGSASHCLYEWPEPDDERADIDDHQEPGDDALDPAERQRRVRLRAGRRNVRTWKRSPQKTRR
jgi:hypothetical protein